jgi:hypothetical protein
LDALARERSSLVELYPDVGARRCNDDKTRNDFDEHSTHVRVTA